MPNKRKSRVLYRTVHVLLNLLPPNVPLLAPQPAQVKLKSQRELKLIFRSNSPLHHLKAGHLPRSPLRIAPQSQQLLPRPSLRKLQQYRSLNPQYLPPLLNKKPPCTVLLHPPRQAVHHLATLSRPPHIKPQLFLILPPLLGLHAPLQFPHLCLHFPLQIAPLSRLKTPVPIISIFILISNIGKVRQKFKSPLTLINSEYPFLTYNIKGKVGQSLSITVNNVENSTVFASLKHLNSKPISFVPKQPFTPSIQAVISNVPATVSARSFLSINNIVSAERMYSFSQSLKSKVPTTNVKVVYRAFSLPYNIKLGVSIYDIRPFVPAPYQCRRCCQFGHSSFVCNSEHQVCSICSGSHFFKQCPTPNARKCPNCSVPHSANWGECPVRKKAAQTIINSRKSVPLMSLKITPPPHVRKPHITVSSRRNPNPYWPEARPPTVTPARKPTNIAPKQPTSVRS